MTPFLLAAPWLGLLLFVRLLAKLPSELPPASALGSDPPFVTVVVPARNERLNIERCLRSLTESEYPAFEIVVVDDRSEDETARLAASVPTGNAERIEVVSGRELPEGWLGKPWACHQGALRARGDLFLFTDADTIHAPDLLARAVAGLHEEGADLLTLVGRQLMESFWERLVQPQVFLMMVFRFPAFESAVRNDRWRDAIANGQYMLFRREAYDRIGGHESVRDEVVEDLALAQQVKRAGLALRVRGAMPGLETRMYRSLAELVEGWSKNIVMGGLQSVPPALRAVTPPFALLLGIALWLAPPAVLVGALLLAPGSDQALWAALVYGLSAATFASFTAELGGRARYGLLYPLGAAVGGYIFARSWLRGGRVRWKGREYSVPAATERP